MTFGFILTRHVNSEITNMYWNHSLKLLRQFYPSYKVIIIDDASNYNFVKQEFEYDNVEIIQSEYPGCGELLPYIYYLKNKWFDKAIIIHDSVFFHKTYDFDVLNKLNINFIMLWVFNNNDNELSNIIRIIMYLKNNKIIINELHNWNKQTWLSCFGAQSIISHDFLLMLNDKYCLTNLIHVIKNRNDRCAFERIIGILGYIETKKKISCFGLINYNNSRSINNDYTFNEYIESYKKGKIISPVVKVWSGR